MPPHFLLIGAAKSGTTSLLSYLGQHPAIFACPVKEPRFFCCAGIRDRMPVADPFRGQITATWGEYLELFRNARPGQVTGEASVSSLPMPAAPERIRAYAPDAKMIAVLRDPAERAFSHHRYFLGAGVEANPDLMACIGDDARRLDGNRYIGFAYLWAGFYARHLRRYLGFFTAGQLKVFLYEDLRSDPVAVARSIFEFLGVDQRFAPDVSIIHNITTVPRIRWLYRLLNGRHGLRRFLQGHLPAGLRHRVRRDLNRLNNSPAIIDPAIRARLIDLYREDILDLQTLLGRDLSRWLAPAVGGGEAVAVNEGGCR